LGCSDHGGESVPPDPMRTGSSRVAHGTCAGDLREWGPGAESLLQCRLCGYRLKKLPPQKSSTPHVYVHASIPSKLLTVSQSFIHHTNLLQSINTPRCLTNYMHMYLKSCNCTEQDKKHLLAFLRLAISTHAASYTRQAFLTLIPIKE
jgi:hypothetical protein